jgi:hypothetical protein
LPKLLADRYIREDINRKFSTDNKSNHEDDKFKPVLNEVYVVPYKINEEVQPYAFSVPANGNAVSSSKDNLTTDRRASSLNLNCSRRTFNNNEEDRSGETHMYLSNHTHLQQNRQTTFVMHNTA